MATCLAICVALVAINTIAERIGNESIDPAKQERIIEAEEFYGSQEMISAKPKVVNVGMYVDSLFNLDLKNSTFKATGWMWYSWRGKCNVGGCSNEDDPYGKFDLNYVSDDANKQASSFGSPVSWEETGNETGSLWNEINFGGSFYTGLDLKKFPFDTQRLQVRVTSPEYEADEVRYIFNEFAAPSSQILIPGYKVLGTQTHETIREYASKFGYTSDATNTRQSQLIAELLITRNTVASLFRYFVPIVVVITVTLIITKLKQEFWEVKLASPATAILSLIFLQDGFRNDLPTTAYLTVLDFYFAISYLVLLLCLVDACIEVGWGQKDTSDDKGGNETKHIRRIDMPEQIAFSLFAVSPALAYGYFLIA